MRMPDFFIAGAPKCGTTSLATWLGEHPAIFMSPVKEPNYFCFDAPRRRTIASAAEYQRLFDPSEPWQTLGEASTAYLFSDLAVPAILEANPRANIIAMVRNPVDMLLSYFEQKRFVFWEAAPEFETAWRLSPERARGRMVSPNCLAHRYMDYRAIGRLGWQVQRLFDWVPHSQVHVIVFDDLVADPQAVYRDALLFLDHAPDGRKDFSARNARKAHRWPALAQMLRRHSGPLGMLKNAMKRAGRGPYMLARNQFHALERRPSPRVPISAELRKEMLETSHCSAACSTAI